MPDATAPPTIDPADVPAMQSIRMSCSARARSTPTCAKPRAAPPDNASPTFGPDIMLRSDRIQHHDLRTLTRRIEERIRVRLNLRFHQRLLDLVSRLFERWHDPPWRSRPETRHINVTVVVGNLLLAY